MCNVLIKLNNIKKIFYTENIETHALSDITVTINKGEYLSITGPSGCGKSTLLSLLGLLDSCSEGQYHLLGDIVSNISNNQRAKIRNQEIGFIFQSFNLISDLNVEENVELPLTYRNNLTKIQRQQKVQQALKTVNMAHRSHFFPSQLSGGQQQRVAIARAIIGDPSIILADEPTGNLDTKNAEIVMQLIEKLHLSGVTICMVTHNPHSAMRANRVIEILDGRIVSDKSITSNKSHQQ